jgi:hypothetical protein
MLIYRITHRHYYGSRLPHECSDHTIGYYNTLEKAHKCVQDFLKEGAECNDDFGFEIWTSKFLPNTEYLVEKILVY